MPKLVGPLVVPQNDSKGATTAWVTSMLSTGSPWALGGNAETTPASQFLGTTDSQDLRFRTNNTEHITLKVDGSWHLGSIGASGITGMERMIINDATGSLSDFAFVAAGGGYPTLNLGASNGTPTARTALTNNGILGNHLWWGYDGASWIQAAENVVTATTVSTGVMTARVDYKVNGTTVASATSGGFTFSGIPAAPTAAVDTNTTQLATTAYVVGQGYLKSATATSTYAPLASPTLTGTPLAPTAATATNTTQIATTAFVKAQSYLTANQAITFSGDASGAGSTAVTLTLANSGATAGTYQSVTVNAKGLVTNGTNPTTLSGFGITDAAPLASPALTGTPTAPTAAVDTNTTQLATTAFVMAQVNADGVNQPVGQIVYGNATGTGLTSSSSFTWDGASGLNASGNATFGGTGTFSGDVNIGGKVKLTAIADPAAAPAGTGYLYAHTVAGRVMPKWVGPAAIDSILQSHLGQDKVCQWSPPGNATTVSNLMGGAVAFTAVGTATARNVATTNMATRTKRLGYVSNTGVGSLTSIRTATAQYTLGVPGTPNMGGFFLVIRFVPSNASTQAAERFFAGMWATTGAPTNVEPSTLTNCIGVAQLSSSNNLQIVYGGSAAQTPIDLGATFPANTLSADLYELVLFAPPNANNTVYYQVTRLNANQASATGTLTAATPGTQLPLNTTLLSAPVIWKTNNTNSGAVGFDLVSAYIGTDQ